MMIEIWSIVEVTKSECVNDVDIYSGLGLRVNGIYLRILGREVISKEQMLEQRPEWSLINKNMYVLNGK